MKARVVTSISATALLPAVVTPTLAQNAVEQGAAAGAEQRQSEGKITELKALAEATGPQGFAGGGKWSCKICK
jgi:hypothetical protein